MSDPIARRFASMLGKPTIIIVLVIALVGGVFYSMTPADRDRWLAALGLSEEAHHRVRLEVVGARREAAKAAEAKRARELMQASDSDASDARSLVDVCEEYYRSKSLGSDQVDGQGSVRLARLCGEP